VSVRNSEHILTCGDVTPHASRCNILRPAIPPRSSLIPLGSTKLLLDRTLGKKKHAVARCIAFVSSLRGAASAAPLQVSHGPAEIRSVIATPSRGDLEGHVVDVARHRVARRPASG
jgi:hypothetical protein